MNEIKSKIQKLAGRHSKAMIALRRQLHQYPEIGLEEFQTQKVIAARLKEAGCKVNTKVWKTAVVGLLEGKGRGKTVGIRSDMDALPVVEKTGYSFASKNPGRMHACGHDVHMAIVWGAAKILSELKGELPGKIKFIYQPSEELSPGGAKFLIEKGVLKNPKVDLMLGLHADYQVPVGKFGLLDGPMMAQADDFKITIYGRSGHGARPHETIDSVVVASGLVIALQNIVARQVNPMESVVVTIGSIHGGTARNIIPESVELTGTVRTLNPKTTKAIPKMIERVISGVCKTHGAKYEFDFQVGYPVVVNDKSANDLYRAAASELYGPDAVIESDIVMGGEDFAYYGKLIPSAFMRFGISNPHIGADKPWHNSEFRVDERAIPLTAALLALAAWRGMEGKIEYRISKRNTHF